MKKVLLAAAVMAVASVFIAAIIMRVFSHSRNVAEIGGRSVSIDEFNIYLYEQKLDFENSLGEDIWDYWFEDVSVESIAKQYALDSVVYIKVAAIQAPRMGVMLNESEIAQVIEETELYIANIGDAFNIDKDVAFEVMQEKLLRDKVEYAVTQNYVLSEVDFLVFYEEFLSSSRSEFLSIEVQYVFIEGVDEAAQQRVGEARNSIYEGVPFETVVMQFSDSYNESEGVSVITEFTEDWNVELQGVAYALEEGEVSDIIASKNGYFILHAKKVIYPDMEELKNNLRERYVLQKKQEIYRQEFEKWSREVAVKINDKVWDEISIML